MDQHGRPTSTITDVLTIPIGEVEALLDANDMVLTFFTWYLNSEGTPWHKFTHNGKSQSIALKRIVAGVLPGSKVTVWHRNGNRLDCRRENLELRD